MVAPDPSTRGWLGVPGAAWRALLLAALALAALASRTAMPVDETRYLAVAWEMWQRGDFLVPYRNGAPYSHKPPLLFWTIHAGWALFGVNDVWPRLISPLLALATLGVTVRIAAVLWPDAPWRGERAAWILSGSLLFAVFSGMLMFDMLLALCVSIGVLGLALAPRSPRRGFALLALAIGGGVMAKGPVVLLHLLPAALLAPWWARGTTMRWGAWYAGVVLAILGGAALALAWAIPAGLRGGEDYRNAIFWGQTAHRMVDSFAHKRPIWWYLPLLPILAAPWLGWLPFWRGLRAARLLSDGGIRLALALATITLVAFSLVSGKQFHYLLPQFPAFALIAAFALDPPQRPARPWLAIATFVLVAALPIALPHVKLPPNLAALHSIAPAWSAAYLALAAWVGWRARTPPRHVPVLSAATLLALATAYLAFFRPLAPAYDVGPVARKLAELQAAGRPIAHDGVYHAQFQFAGRLERPITPLATHAEAAQWIAAHPDGALVLYFRPPQDPAPFGPLITAPYRGRTVAVFDASGAAAPLSAAEAETEPDPESESADDSRRRPVPR
jgi:4-amino-4-deoxy-L-arabinose transferase-like glycosyltransferase